VCDPTETESLLAVSIAPSQDVGTAKGLFLCLLASS